MIKLHHRHRLRSVGTNVRTIVRNCRLSFKTRHEIFVEGSGIRGAGILHCITLRFIQLPVLYVRGISFLPRNKDDSSVKLATPFHLVLKAVSLANSLSFLGVELE
jgi:hypothetical protein